MAAGSTSATIIEPWPELPAASWQETRDTFHMWTQIVGKVALALAPKINHWWGSTLRVDAAGLHTTLLPYGKRGVDFTFDLNNHVLSIRTTTGQRRELRLEPRSVADFYREFRARLAELDIEVPILARPVEIPVAIPFESDEEHASYDPAAVERFLALLVSADRVLSEFRSRFTGKVSPVHFFWGGFDLAVTRFSGRRAPKHPGGSPNCADWVMEEAYSHEVSSCGYWPAGAGGEGVFYSYSYPEPPGFRAARVLPDSASYDEAFGEFVLPYADIRSAEDPDAAVLAFVQSTYDAAADLADWDRQALEEDHDRFSNTMGHR
jgi:hypothetical protein